MKPIFPCKGGKNMYDFSKEDAKQAADQFCYALSIWTKSLVSTGGFFDEYEKDNDNVYILDKKNSEELANSNFVKNIMSVYDFSETGAWEGEYIFEDSMFLENTIGEILTELSAFEEVFKCKQINFHDPSGDDLMNITINSKNIIEILSQVISMVLARFSLITGTFIDLEQLAMLAGVSLKTVRNAVSSKGHDKIVLSNSTIEGKPCVDAEEALRWLQTKKGYTGPNFVNELPHYNSYSTLGQLQHHCLSLMKKESIELESLKDAPMFDTDKIASFKKLTKLKVDETLDKIDPQTLLSFGDLCKVDNIETFVREGSKIIASSVAEYKAKKLFA